MGTRHSQTVINRKGEVKLRQYGQWDGYPSGQGVEILRYLKEGNLELYQQNLETFTQITDEEIKTVNSIKDWGEAFPYLSRDCGSKIHKMVENGEVKFVNIETEEEMNKWCEGFYTIDFQKGLFISEYGGNKTEYRLDKLPTEKAYLKKMESEI